MEFLADKQLTYSDLCIVPGPGALDTRDDADTRPYDHKLTHQEIPVAVANMTAVSGRRLAETVARRGAVAVLPQDAPFAVAESAIQAVKGAHLLYETPVIISPDDKVSDARRSIFQRWHGAALVMHQGDLVGVVNQRDIDAHQDHETVGGFMTTNVDPMSTGLDHEEMYNWFLNRHLHYAPVFSGDQLVGVMTRESVTHSMRLRPAADTSGRLVVASAVGINGDVVQRAKDLYNAGADIIVLDTAHGDQPKMYHGLEAVRGELGPDVVLVAGNVVTAGGTERLIKAGADIVKVGVGPGAMCTTRMMTAVGRPQFSAVVECANAARKLGKSIWADGGVKDPRDVILAVAGGASSAMIGTWFAKTFESPGDMFRVDGRYYKECHGMASSRAVDARFADQSALARELRGWYAEGISTSRNWLDPEAMSANHLIKMIHAGLCSAVSYSGARDLEEFHDRVVIGEQSAYGYTEGMPVPVS